MLAIRCDSSRSARDGALRSDKARICAGMIITLDDTLSENKFDVILDAE